MAAEPPNARRAFLSVLAQALGAFAAAMAVIPGLGFLAHPLRKQTIRGSDSPLRVANERDVKPGRPVRVTAVGPRQDAWMRLDKVTLGSLWLVRASENGFASIQDHNRRLATQRHHSILICADGLKSDNAFFFAYRRHGARCGDCVVDKHRSDKPHGL